MLCSKRVPPSAKGPHLAHPPKRMHTLRLPPRALFAPRLQLHRCMISDASSLCSASRGITSAKDSNLRIAVSCMSPPTLWLQAVFALAVATQVTQYCRHYKCEAALPAELFDSSPAVRGFRHPTPACTAVRRPTLQSGADDSPVFFGSERSTAWASLRIGSSRSARDLRVARMAPVAKREDC